MKQFFLTGILLLVSLGTQAEVRYLQFSKNKVMAYEYIRQNAQGATLLLLPGVNRALSSGDQAVRGLLQKGWNLLIPSLPTQPLSIEGLERTQNPFFTTDSSLRVGDFAKDIETLIGKVGAERVIPVTLSYSSAIGAFLNSQKFPHVIETVPLGVATEADPEAAKNAELWESWLRLNPLMAPFWIRQFRDQAYANHWGAKVDANISADATFYGENPRVSDIKSGYVAMARAVEDFSFPKWNFKNDSRTRDFVFAAEENPERAKNQLIVLKNYMAAGKPVRVVVVEKTGHVMPTENPLVYAAVVDLLASTVRQSSVQFAIVRSAESVKGLQWQGLGALNDWIENRQKTQ